MGRPIRIFPPEIAHNRIKGAPKLSHKTWVAFVPGKAGRNPDIEGSYQSVCDSIVEPLPVEFFSAIDFLHGFLGDLCSPAVNNDGKN